MPNYYKVNKRSEDKLSYPLTTEIARLVGNVSIKDSLKKIALIQELVDEECWLACDCGVSRELKYLFPVQREESFHFRRRNKSDSHSNACLFNNLQSIEYSDNDIITLPPKNGEIFNMCKKTGLTTPDKNDTETTSIVRTIYLSKLGRLLIHAMSKAKLNVQNNAKADNIYQQFNDLISSFKNIYFDQNHSISDILFSSFSKYNEIQIKLKELETNWKSKKTQPHGFALVLINEISEEENNYLVDYHVVDAINNTLKNEKFRIYKSYFKSTINKINGYVSLKTGGPWLGLFLIRKTRQYKDNPKSETFLPTRAFLYPVHSAQNIFPIESEKERQVFSKIIQLMNYNKDRKITCEVEKVLHSIPNDDQSVNLGAIQPDFFIRSREHCVLEVMGIKDEKYILRKEELKKYYKNKNITFVELDATYESNSLEKEINNKVKDAFLSVIQ